MSSGLAARITRRVLSLPSFIQPATNMAVMQTTAAAAAAAGTARGSRQLCYDSSLRPIATQMGSASNAEFQLLPPRIKLSRVTEMEDTQMFGLVHGCLQLQLVEDAGVTLTTKYCKHFSPKLDDEICSLTACLERADFLRPMMVGDIAEVEAEITYTTARSLQVTASVYAKNQEDESRYKTIDAKMWFVVKTCGDNPVTVSVPPLRNTDGSPVQRPESEQGYLAVKEQRDRIHPDLFDRPYRPNIVNYYAPADSIEPCTVDFSRYNFAQPVHPNHCVPGENYCRGAVILRLMDECAASTAVTHTNYFSFTSKMEAIVLHRKVDASTLLQTYAKVLFSSSKTLEVAVRVEQQRLYPGRGIYTARVADGLMTFMVVDTETGKTRPVPPVKLITEKEKKIFQARKEIYDQQKLARLKASL